jgi:hypothetical protein
MPGERVPPAGMPPPVPGVSPKLWAYARSQMVVEACEAALYDVAGALLGVTRWQDYWPTLQRFPVPKSAGASPPEFGALIGEWIPLNRSEFSGDSVT